jgi:hypothetical protein
MRIRVFHGASDRILEARIMRGEFSARSKRGRCELRIGRRRQASESEQRYACCQSLAVNDSMSQTRVSANAAQTSSEVALQQIGDGSARVSVKMGFAGRTVVFAVLI